MVDEKINNFLDIKSSFAPVTDNGKILKAAPITEPLISKDKIAGSKLSKKFLEAEALFAEKVAINFANDRAIVRTCIEWDSYNNEDRKSFARSVVSKLNGYLKPENRAKVSFNLEDDELLCASYNRINNSYELPNDLSKFNPIPLLSTVVHEWTHCRQDKMDFDNHDHVSLEDRRIIQLQSKAYYIQPSENAVRYLEQPIELHSRFMEQKFTDTLTISNKIIAKIYSNYEAEAMERLLNSLDIFTNSSNRIISGLNGEKAKPLTDIKDHIATSIEPLSLAAAKAVLE